MPVVLPNGDFRVTTTREVNQEMLKREVLPARTFMARFGKVFVEWFAPASGMLPPHPSAMIFFPPEALVHIQTALGLEGPPLRRQRI